MKNAQASCQRVVDIIVSRVKWQSALVHLDDIIVYPKFVTEHFVQRRTVPALLQNTRIALKLSKSSFFGSMVPYLELTIRLGKLTVKSKSCKAFRKSLPPTNQERSCLRICNVHRRFLPNFARVATLPNVRTGKNQPFDLKLNFVELDVIQTLKERLMSPTILALLRHGQRYTMDTDACAYQVGCALLQQHSSGDELPIEH